MKLTKVKSEIIAAYIEFVRENNKHPIRSDMLDLGYSNNQIRRHFTSLANLRTTAKRLHPKEFEGIVDSSLFTKKKFRELEGEVKKYKKFVITTVVNDCKIDVNFLKSIDTYCKKNNAALLLLPSHDPAHNLDREYEWNFDSIIAKRLLVFENLELNSNLHLSAIKLQAKHIDPITGLERIGQRDGSFIYASPKQRLKYVPTSNTKLPHAIMTTGAITKANYTTKWYPSERTAHIADHDHVMGAIIVELQDNDIFHFRQIQANKDGAFIDLGVTYDGDETYKTNPEVFVMGDWHSGDTDRTVANVWLSIIDKLKPKTLVIHDLFNGSSINPHNVGKLITNATNPIKNLEDELEMVYNDLRDFGHYIENIIIVKSNHDEFLERYLQSGEYQNQPHNCKIGMELALAMLNGHNPLKYAMDKFGKLSNIRWLSRDEDVKLAGIQLGAHGDKGCNGSKGNIKSMEMAYNNCVVGHSHSAQILRGAWCVGTSTKLKLDYNSGPSSWTHTSCLVYQNGMRQLVNSIGGKWKT